MNFFITILLCVFISVITEAAVFPSNDVAGLKNKIIAAANDLTHYNNTYKSNFESLLNKLKIKYINDLHNTIDFIRNETNVSHGINKLFIFSVFIVRFYEILTFNVT